MDAIAWAISASAFDLRGLDRDMLLPAFAISLSYWLGSEPVHDGDSRVQARCLFSDAIISRRALYQNNNRTVARSFVCLFASTIFNQSFGFDMGATPKTWPRSPPSGCAQILWEILRGPCGSLFCRALAELPPHHLLIKYQTQKDLDGGLI